MLLKSKVLGRVTLLLDPAWHLVWLRCMVLKVGKHLNVLIPHGAQILVSFPPLSRHLYIRCCDKMKDFVTKTHTLRITLWISYIVCKGGAAFDCSYVTRYSYSVLSRDRTVFELYGMDRCFSNQPSDLVWQHYLAPKAVTSDFFFKSKLNSFIF